MSKLINLERLDRMDYLIKMESTGNPSSFARKLYISRSTLFEYLKYLKYDCGSTIVYNKMKESYLYRNEPKRLWSLINNNNRYQTQKNTDIEVCMCSMCANDICINRI